LVPLAIMLSSGIKIYKRKVKARSLIKFPESMLMNNAYKMLLFE